MFAIFKRMLIAATSILLLSTSYAATYYRHLPFQVELSANDNVVVDYEFSAKRGVLCTSNQHIPVE
jgi:hypothetical protein